MRSKLASDTRGNLWRSAIRLGLCKGERSSVGPSELAEGGVNRIARGL